MARPREEKLDFIRNVGGCVMTYLRAGNDKTAIEESLMTLIEYAKNEMRRLGITDVSMPSIPDPKSSKPVSKKG